MLVVTTENIPTFEISQVIGVVSGSTPTSCDLYSTGIKNLDGGLRHATPGKLTDAREVAVAALVANARKRGANAVVGMRFDTRAIGPRWAEICAYGTAVRVRRIPAAHLHPESAARFRPEPATHLSAPRRGAANPRESLNAIAGTLKDAENGQRDDVITGEGRYPAPYERPSPPRSTGSSPSRHHHARSGPGHHDLNAAVGQFKH